MGHMEIVRLENRLLEGKLQAGVLKIIRIWKGDNFFVSNEGF